MKNLEHLDWKGVLSVLESLASSEPAREHLRHLSPLASERLAIKSFEEIDEARLVVSAGRRPTMESLDLFGTWYERLKRRGVLKIMELKDVRRFCLEVVGLVEVAETIESPWFREMLIQIVRAKEPLSAIDQIITPGGEIKTDASETLSELFKARQDRERSLHSTLNRLVKAHGLESVLQDKFVTNREGRWVLPIKSGMQHSFEGIIHDSSQTKQTVFMEPQEVVAINNEIRELDIKIEKEIETLLTELSHYLATLSEKFEISRKFLLAADIRLAQAQLAQQMDAHPCEFDNKRLALNKVRHPLLVLNQSKVVANDVELTEGHRILLLSGPNAGGKTVLLKAVGIAAHMARCGLPICADEGSIVPFFESFHTAVGDEQSVHQNLSTFAAHLTTLTVAAKAEGPKHLILIDEICGSTDPEEGGALAKAFIEQFDKNKTFGIITSHLGALKEGWTKESGVVTGRLEFDELEGKATYKLFLGLPGQSQALKTAKIIGVPSSILDRAVQLLRPETRERKKKLDDLESIKDEMLQSKERLESERAQASSYKEKYLEMLENFKREKEKWLTLAVQKAEQKINELLEAAKQNQTNLKAMSDFKSQLPTVVKTPQKASIQTAAEFAVAFPPGSPIFAPQLQTDGIIQSLPDAKGMVTVMAQSMRFQVFWKDLQPARSLARTAAAPRSEYMASTNLGEERTVDLRGQRVDEAIRELESQLDLAMRNKEDRLKVIHGHGTEALKKSIRTFLSRSVYVRKWNSGDTSSGGDGITWIELSDL